ncbi:MAG: EAL domain-containing protein [Firmicutes bacterium]|nr:EAL domain-containing protein [Bacillota bacterium]
MTKSELTLSSKTRRISALLLCLLVAAAALMPAASYALDKEKIVRVGWYDSSYNTMDSYGRRSGYAYEYQLKISAYTGWKYEYVTGSWPDLLQMLINGDIDMMSDVSYTKERSEYMLYPDYAMGTEEYFLFTAPGKRAIKSSDPSTLNGKRVGVNRDSYQAMLFDDWAARNNVSVNLVMLNTTEDESLDMLENGELDAYITVDSFTNPDKAEPVFKIGSSDFYFAISKKRPELLEELNFAMSKIQDENRYYNQVMYERYINTVGSNAFLSQEELDWLEAHGNIRVGYQDNYLAFCAEDVRTGELTGAMKDYLGLASDCLKNAHLNFETKAYATVEDAIAALKRGDIDLVFPANLSGYEGEKLGIVMTMPLMTTDVYAIVPQNRLNSFARKEHVIVAVNKGNPNYDAFLLENFPAWRKVYYPTTEECLVAVDEGVADCILISSFRYNNLARLCDKYNLKTFPTGVDLDYCFALNGDDAVLYAIMSKVIGQIPSSSVNAALSVYVTEDARLGLRDFIADNIVAFMIAVAAILLVILALLVHSNRMKRKAEQLISATEKDELTGLYNRDYFFEYANRMRREHPDIPMDAIVLNIEKFHSINALKGMEYGDVILRALGNESRRVAEENSGIAGRFGADRFDIYCRSGLDYRKVFDRLQDKLNEMSPNTSVRLRMGVAKQMDVPEPVQQFDRARTACNMARGNYKEHLIVFDESIRDKELKDQILLNDLRHALDNYEFEVYYQPQFDIRFEPPKLVSAEALIRWNHHRLGMIPPDDFIPLFESNGTISEVDKYVWSQVARQISLWRSQLGVSLPVSVNLSRVDVFDPKLVETLDAILEENSVDRSLFKLEITESAYTENADQLISVAEELRKKGYTVEMDDFGTGYSSLNMLSSMPIDVLKIDRTFIENIEHSEKNVQLVALILDIAKDMNMSVVAEGVETASQMQLLKDQGCYMVQGFYLSRPLHYTDFEAAFLQGSER